ncbi:hypothetical protein BDF21DRAFT_388890 [Thamnidium elegans]|nr:hypothetical protein BDF21DRAFT_388890 [Thamnidium elegans]
MADRLRERCSVKTVYASPVSNSRDEIASRDLCEKSHGLLKQLSCVSGSTQDMMNHIKTSKQAICLIVIDFAGLSSDCEDIKSFVRSHRKLKTIVIDSLPVNNTVKMFTRQDILHDNQFTKYFQCRKAPVKRSLK